MIEFEVNPSDYCAEFEEELARFMRLTGQSRLDALNDEAALRAFLADGWVGE